MSGQVAAMRVVNQPGSTTFLYGATDQLAVLVVSGRDFAFMDLRCPYEDELERHTDF